MSTSVKNCTEQCGADQSYSLPELVDKCCKGKNIDTCCSGECRDELKKSTILRATGDSRATKREKPVDFSDICKNSSNPLDSCACQFCNKDGVTNFEECVAKKATEIAECLDKKYGGNGKADLCKNLLEQTNMPTGCRACYACSYNKLCNIEKFQQEEVAPSPTYHYIEEEEEKSNKKMAIFMLFLAVIVFVIMKYCCK
jgi:hypothetical protein